MIVHLVSPVRLRASQEEPTTPAGSSSDPAAQSSSPPPRTIEGRAIAYDTDAVASDGVTYRFRAGSLRPRREVTPVLLGHDPQRPAGILRELVDSPEGPTAVIAVDQTPDGEMALAQAASGSRAGLSIGAEPIVFSLTDTGVVDVEMAELAELSLVPIPAWSGATVSRVTAQAGGAPMQAQMPAPEPDPIVDPEPPAPAPPDPEPLRAQLIVRADHSAPLVLAERDRRPGVSLDAYVGALVRAARGDQSAASIIAAVGPPSHVVDNPGVLPPAYTTEILGGLPDIRALVGICATRAMPASGMLIRKPTWTTKPAGGWMVDDTAAAATNTPKIGLHDVPVRQWAYAFATSQAVAERSSPDFIEAVYRGAIQDYHNDVEAEIAAIIAADAASTSGTIGEGVGAIYTSTGRSADLLLCSPDTFGLLLDNSGFQRFSSGTASAGPGGVRGNIFGLDVVVSGALAPGSLIVGLKNAIEFRETQPIRLSANVVGAMQIELGVTCFASFDQELPNAFVLSTPPTPGVERSSSRSSAK